MSEPAVTFAIASFNSGALLGDAVRSALGQRDVTVEVVIVDDGSTDDSRQVADALARAHPRVRSLATSRNLGPGGARNLALAAARGTWFAVLDSDDLLHPDRSIRLLAEAERSGADMIADDLLLFDHARIAPAALFLTGRRAAGANWIDLAGYLGETRMFSRSPNLGFLKPMIRTALLRERHIRYDERLRIAEDDALVIELLRGGARYRLLPAPLYFYRKHAASISHRLSGDHVGRMMAAGERLKLALAGNAHHAAALAPRHRALVRAWAFTHWIEAAKARRPGAMLRLMARHPTMLPMLAMPLAARLRRLASRLRPGPAPIRPDPKAVLFVSRQRLVGATNGSSAYLLAIASAVRAAGFVPHLVQPSPRVFGRTPFYRRLPELDVFASHRIRGAFRIGERIIARDPLIYAAAAHGALAGLLRHAGVSGRIAADRKAPPSISAPWSREDLRFVADQAALRPCAAIADYVFQAEALPYLFDPAVRTATVMHDLFHARAGQFGEGGDSVAVLDAPSEIRLLGHADAVIAIQAAEAAFVRDRVAETRSILAPMPARPVTSAQPGDPDRLLFVGSNTAPNIVGLRWFLEAVWPAVRTHRPTARLDVVGTVARAFDAAPGGVRFLGLVDDLAGGYAASGIVISPLLQGSGLKIKLIEALAHGKASVVTGTTLQGVEELLRGAVMRADDAASFAAAIARLQDDPEARALLAGAALKAATDHFGAAACMADFTSWLRAAAS